MTKIKENMGKLLKGIHVYPYEVTLKNENGQETTVEINAKKVEYNDQLLDFIVLQRYVTQRAQERKNLQSVHKSKRKTCSKSSAKTHLTESYSLI